MRLSCAWICFAVLPIIGTAGFAQQPDATNQDACGKLASLKISNATISVAQTVAAGTGIATIDPGTEQVWEALRALYVIGQPEDIAAVLPYERELPDVPDHVRQQAIETEKAIRSRAVR